MKPIVLFALIISAWTGSAAIAEDEKPICRTRRGTLVVVYKGDNILMCSRSTDDGATWSKSEPIATSAKRPDSIREVKKFEVYPGTCDVLPDDRILVTWNYIADDKAQDGYYERALLYTLSSDDGLTWSEQKLIGPVEGQHLGAVRHNVLSWPDGRWLLPLRVGSPHCLTPKQGNSRCSLWSVLIGNSTSSNKSPAPQKARSWQWGRSYYIPPTRANIGLWSRIFPLSQTPATTPKDAI
jgi:hypothetical protein